MFSGTKGVSSLWTCLKEKESNVSKNYLFYKNSFISMINNSTRRVMLLTDCFAKADSVGYILVDDMLNSLKDNRGGSDKPSYFSYASADVVGDDPLVGECIDIYPFYQLYCKSAIGAKSVLADLETLVAVLGSNADSIAERCAALIREVGGALTVKIVKQWEKNALKYYLFFILFYIILLPIFLSFSLSLSLTHTYIHTLFLSCTKANFDKCETRSYIYS